MTGPVAWDRLPDGWEAVQIRRVASIGNGSDYKDVEVADGGYPVYGSGGEFRRASAYLYDGESVLFGRKGTIDRPLHVRGKFWTVDTMFYTELTPRVHGRFLYYYATTMPFSYYSTSTALPSMTQGDLAGHTMPLPPLAEQQAIADFLDEQTSRIDTLIAKQTQLITTLRERAATVTALAMNDASAPRVAMRRLGRTGGGAGFPHEYQGQIDHPLPFYKVKALAGADRRGHLGDAPDTIDRTTADALGATVFPAGSLVYAKVGAALMLGRIRALRRPACIDNNLAAFVPGPRLDPAYARHALTQFPFRALVNPGAVPSLSDRHVLDFKIPLPSMGEQIALVSRLDQETSRIDALIDKTEQHVALAKERRSALITAAVTGQIDVRTAGREAQGVA